MFAFLEKKKSQDELDRCIRRLCNLTTPNYGGEELGVRRSRRSNRTLPALLCPWQGGRPVVAEHTFVITRDLSVNGVALVLTQPLHADEFVLGFWLHHPAMPEPLYLLGRKRRLEPLGGGFWTMGVDLVDLIHNVGAERLKSLLPLAAKLLPVK